ncbi:MAG: hypothetical protein KC462_08380, partial [Cyanobacteria bacterium HKST-UBA05]|nr:hypothetical protein [Cyanobacteria bacterium HKST-UBA05]
IFPTRQDLQQKKLVLYRGEGCPKCNQSGMLGRTGLYEIMVFDRKIKQMINDRRLSQEIEDAAVAAGMKTLHMAGMEKLLKGVICLEELIRILGVNLGRTV